MNYNQPLIESRRRLIDRLDAKKRFQERHAAAVPTRRRLFAGGPNLLLGNPQDVVYYDRHSFVTGYAAAYFDETLVTERFDDAGRALAHHVHEDPLTDRIESVSGRPIAYVRPLRGEPGVLVLGPDGGLAGSVVLKSSSTAVALGPDGELVAKLLYGPDQATWLDASGNTVGWAKSKLLGGAWLATDDAWHLFCPGWRSTHVLS